MLRNGKYIFVGAVSANVCFDVGVWTGLSLFGLLFLLCLDIDAIRDSLQ